MRSSSLHPFKMETLMLTDKRMEELWARVKKYQNDLWYTAPEARPAVVYAMLNELHSDYVMADAGKGSTDET